MKNISACIFTYFPLFDVTVLDTNHTYFFTKNESLTDLGFEGLGGVENMHYVLKLK